MGDEPLPLPQPPPGLKARGLRFWESATTTHELEIDELELLAEVARELDTAEALAEVLERDGLIVPGSAGQPRVHPASSELRASRLAIGKLLGQLGLPDEEDEPVLATPLSARGRKAANTRWAKERARQERPLTGRRGA